MSPATVELRDLLGETRPLTPFVGVEWRDPYMVEVPAFGVLIIGSLRVDEPIARLTPQWRALLVQPDAEHRIGPASNHVPYDVTVGDDGTLEVELLPNASGEDRLVVVVHPARAAVGVSVEPQETK
jgi:hypothetical protein